METLPLIRVIIFQINIKTLLYISHVIRNLKNKAHLIALIVRETSVLKLYTNLSERAVLHNAKFFSIETFFLTIPTSFQVVVFGLKSSRQQTGY